MPLSQGSRCLGDGKRSVVVDGVVQLLSCLFTCNLSLSFHYHELAGTMPDLDVPLTDSDHNGSSSDASVAVVQAQFMHRG